MAKVMTIGFIGNGKSTNRYHLPFVLTRDNIKVKTIYNRTIKHDKWKEIEDVKYTTNIDELLNDPQIDLVVVTTPVKHYEFSKMVLEHNKNCLCEKPFMDTYKEAKELFDLAKSKNLLIQAYQNRRFDSDFLTVQKVIESGKLGDLLELEMHFDYYRPEIPESITEFNPYHSYLYGHGCHTLDQVISYFGKPDSIHYDVRQLLGEGRMNDYFDLDLYYNKLKVSVKSSYFRIKSRPSFVVYGKKGMFEHYYKDLQETDLKKFYLPIDHKDFGVDTPEQYGTLTYYDENNNYHEEKVVSTNGDYGRVYDDIYQVIINGKEPTITPSQTLLQMQILEEGIKNLK
ncbi:MAG: Gfo/Idh/MocA family oxidoreductase [Thomasclavelia sp.]|nr:Gfo/Idh/MocA family oxidoreductase [Thomasclavelia sp.]